MIATARALGSPIVFFQNGWEPARHEAGTQDSPNWWKSNALKLMRADPKLDGTLITRGTWDYELVAELRPAPEDIVLNKTRYSGFWGTPLDAMLRARRIRNLLFVGIATNVCLSRPCAMPISSNIPDFSLRMRRSMPGRRRCRRQRSSLSRRSPAG